MEGPHIRLANMTPVTPQDEQRAAEIALAARQALAKYADYQVALQDGYEIFVPEVPQEVYHFINFREAYRNYNSLDPARPTALLYKKVGAGYEWAGVMYSAPMTASLEELDRRYPLSMAQWHAHINVCLPPQGMGVKEALTGGEFGFEGSITTQDACQQAGGRFMPDVFGWMVHVMWDGVH